MRVSVQAESAAGKHYEPACAEKALRKKINFIYYWHIGLMVKTNGSVITFLLSLSNTYFWEVRHDILQLRWLKSCFKTEKLTKTFHHLEYNY